MLLRPVQAVFDLDLATCSMLADVADAVKVLGDVTGDAVVGQAVLAARCRWAIHRLWAVSKLSGLRSP